MNEISKHVRRLGALTAAAAAAGSLMLSAGALAQQPGKLKVGLMLPYTGTFAALGTSITNAFKLAVDENGGKLGGREIEYFTVSEPVPYVTQSGFNASADYEIAVANLKAGTTYQLYRTTTLASGSWTAVGAAVPVEGTTQVFTDEDPPKGRMFYRVDKVTPP